MPIHASIELVEAMRGNAPPFVDEATQIGMRFGEDPRGLRQAHGVRACDPVRTMHGDLVWAACCADNHNTHPIQQRVFKKPLDTAEDDFAVECPDCLSLMREIVVEQDPVRWDYLEEHGINFDKRGRTP